MKYFLVYNMGKSGGAWFEAVLNSHERVLAWTEADKPLFLPKGTLRDPHLLAYWHEREEENLFRSLGWIKSFGATVRNYVSERGGRVIQMFRNPVVVLNLKMGQRMSHAEALLGRPLATEQDIFEGHAIFFAKQYETYIKRAVDCPLLCLENLNVSLATDCWYLRGVLEYLTQLEWTDEDIFKARLIPPLVDVIRGGPQVTWQEWLRDEAPVEIWRQWKPWKRTIFLAYFQDMMLTWGWKYGRVV